MMVNIGIRRYSTCYSMCFVVGISWGGAVVSSYGHSEFPESIQYFKSSLTVVDIHFQSRVKWIANAASALAGH